MSRYSTDEKILMVKLYYENGSSFTKTIRKFATIKKLKKKNEYPTRATVSNIIKNFENSGNVADCPRSGRPSVSGDQITEISDAVTACCTSSTREISALIGISKTTVHKVLRQHLNLYPYKVQIAQNLSAEQIQKRKLFCTEILERCKADDGFLKSVVWSDEANFFLNGWVNKQNTRFWGSANPQKIIEVAKFSRRITVFVAVGYNFLLGPYFFEDGDGKPINVNGENYCAMLSDFLIPELKRRKKCSKTVFQQDGATSHVTKPVKELLTGTFGSRIISRGFEFEWPPNSPDLSPLDFWLWGVLKDRVYTGGKPEDMDELKYRINSALCDFSKTDITQVVNSCIARFEACLQVNGSHFENIFV